MLRNPLFLPFPGGEPFTSARGGAGRGVEAQARALPCMSHTPYPAFTITPWGSLLRILAACRRLARTHAQAPMHAPWQATWDMGVHLHIKQAIDRLGVRLTARPASLMNSGSTATISSIVLPCELHAHMHTAHVCICTHGFVPESQRGHEDARRVFQEGVGMRENVKGGVQGVRRNKRSGSRTTHREAADEERAQALGQLRVRLARVLDLAIGVFCRVHLMLLPVGAVSVPSSASLFCASTRPGRGETAQHRRGKRGECRMSPLDCVLLSAKDTYIDDRLAALDFVVVHLQLLIHVLQQSRAQVRQQRHAGA